MKKLLLITLVCWCAIAVSAQNQVQTAILQHGAETTVYNGSQALVNAYNAAVNGDVITLSAGTFTPTNIEKSVSLYGAGFENHDDLGTHLTTLGGFAVGLANDTLRNVHIEGIYVNGRLRIAGGPTDQLHIVKCYVNEQIFFEQMSQNTIIDQCIVKSNLTSYNSRYLAKNMLVTNTLVMGNLSGFLPESTVMIDHCMLRNQLWKYDETAAFTWINCIFYNDDRACWDSDYRMVSPASVVRNCIHVPILKLAPMSCSNPMCGWGPMEPKWACVAGMAGARLRASLSSSACNLPSRVHNSRWTTRPRHANLVQP